MPLSCDEKPGPQNWQDAGRRTLRCKQISPSLCVGTIALMGINRSPPSAMELVAKAETSNDQKR